MYDNRRNYWESVTVLGRIMSDSECMTLCEETEDCVAFTFYKYNYFLKICYLFGEPVGGTKAKNSPYYNSGVCIGKVRNIILSYLSKKFLFRFNLYKFSGAFWFWKIGQDRLKFIKQNKKSNFEIFILQCVTNIMFVYIRFYGLYITYLSYFMLWICTI